MCLSRMLVLFYYLLGTGPFDFASTEPGYAQIERGAIALSMMGRCRVLLILNHAYRARKNGTGSIHSASG